MPGVVETEALTSTSITVCTAYFHSASQNKYQGGMRNGDFNEAVDGRSVKSKGYFCNGS